MNNPTFRPAMTVSPTGYESQADGSTVIDDFDVYSSAHKEAVHQHHSATYEDNFYEDSETGERFYDNSADNADYEAMVESVGGLDAYQEMLDWASENLTQEDIEAYDEVMDSGDLNLTNSFVQQLAERYYNRNEQIEVEGDEVSDYIFNNVIDREGYSHLVDYVRSNYDADTIDQINTVIDSGNVEMIRNIIRQIQSQMTDY